MSMETRNTVFEGDEHTPLQPRSTVRDSLWVFGYGSLMWFPNIPFKEKRVGYVEGYKRRFWLGDSEYRGKPGAPARVVTLIPKSEEKTWGIAYKVSPHDVPEVMSYLNEREIGYSLHKLLFHQHQDSSPIITLAYVGTEMSESYLGPASIEDIAKQVVNSRGPNGCNAEYVLNLAKSMRTLVPSVYDSHLFKLEDKIREFLKKQSLPRIDADVKVGATISINKKRENCACKYCSKYCTTTIMSRKHNITSI